MTDEKDPRAPLEGEPDEFWPPLDEYPGSEPDPTEAMDATQAMAPLEPEATLDDAVPEPEPEPEPEPDDHRLPSLEELTFAPRPGAPEANEAAEEHATPAFAPRALSKRRAATLAAFADALIPHGGAVPESAQDVGVAPRLDAALATWDPGARRTFSRMLTWLEWSTMFTRALRPFSRQSHAAREAAIARAMRSKLLVRRAAIDLLKFYCLNQWASSPAVERRIGFDYGCVTTDPPREGEALEVLSYPRIDRDHVEECDVVVVGSGAGGAVVAKEMAELGMSVVVVEEGGYYTRSDFTGPPFERFQRLYRRQGLTAAMGTPVIPLPLGMAVGGSTLVNAGTCFRTPERVLERWEKEFAIPQIDPESMRPFFDRVERIQRVQPVPESLLGANAEVFRRGVTQLGLHGAPVRRNIEGCRGCGVCAFGCPSDAKLSTHLTYLPRAQKQGATIFANARATRILVEQGRARGVVASLLDPATREPKASLTVRAKVVVLAAGAVHTPALLATNALGNRSGELGRNLRIHPAASVGAFFEEDVRAWRGTMQSFYVDDWHESHDLMIEVTSSVPSVGAGTFPGYGLGLKDLLGSYPNLASAGVFVSDTSSGRVIARAGKEPLVTYRLNKQDTMKLVRGFAHVAEIFLAAGARTVMTGLPGFAPISSTSQLQELREESVKPGALRLTAFHPVGTARMGPDAATSVVDPWGAVHGLQNLFVADASMLPGCPTVNPQITIMAFATRTADHIARHAARYFS